MRELNKSLILEAIRKHGPLSRAKLNKLLDLSFPTISSNVGVLLEKGWIIETEKDTNQMGRKATLLQYNGNKGCVIGVDLGRSHITAIMVDVAGNELAEMQEKGPWEDGRALMMDTCKLLGRILDFVADSKDRLMCIAVGIPGYRDEITRKNILAPFLKGWEDIDVEKELRGTFDTELLIDNSINYSAIGEKWKGNAKGSMNMLYLGFGVGIGSALILNGELFSGNNGVAGEIGYCVPDFALARAEYSVEGVFERIVTGRFSPHNTDRFGGNMKEAFDEAEKGDQEAIDHLEFIKHSAEVVLVNSITMLNPERVVFSGNIGKALFEKYNEEFRAFLSVHVPFVPKLEISALGEKAGALGAAAAALRSVHSGFSIT